MGSLLWNLYYDDVFRIEMSNRVTLIGYADDLAIAKSGTVLRHKMNTATISLIEWLKGKDLRIAPEKTEVVLLGGCRKLSD